MLVWYVCEKHKYHIAHIRHAYTLLICICFQLDHSTQMWLQTVELIMPNQYNSNNPPVDKHLKRHLSNNTLLFPRIIPVTEYICRSPKTSKMLRKLDNEINQLLPSLLNHKPLA